MFLTGIHSSAIQLPESKEAIILPMYRKSMLILLLIVLAVAGGTYYGCYMQEKESIQLDAASQAVSQEDRAEITVYVTGAINKPGVVTVREGARMADVVKACGGLLPTADGEKVNMAQVLKDGQQVRVPEKAGSETAAAAKSGNANPAAKSSTSSKAAPSGPVNINTAGAEELDTLPGIGPAMAQRIIEFRETEGAFTAIEDIKKVKGIGEAKFEKMKDKICI